MDIPKKNSKQRLREGKFSSEPDYYLEHGRVVFTRAYHVKRGYCCMHGCRHCPYKSSQK